MPPLGQLHIDRALTEVSIRYANELYNADDIFPILPVEKRSDKFFMYRREDAMSGSGLDAQGLPTSLRKPGAEAGEIDYQNTTGQYYAEEYSLRGIVTDAEYKIADTPLMPEIDQTEEIVERLKIDNEMAVFGQTMNIANYPGGNTAALTAAAGGGGTGTSWNNYNGPLAGAYYSNPFKDIKTMKLAVILGIAKEANRLALTIGAAKTLADHPLIKDVVKYTHEDALTREGLPKVVRGLEVVECRAIRNTAAEGVAFNGNYIAAASDGSDCALAFYFNPTPRPKTVAYGWTFEAPDDTTGGKGFQVRKWREEKRKGTMVEVSVTRTWKFIGVNAANQPVGAYLLTSVTA